MVARLEGEGVSQPSVCADVGGARGGSHEIDEDIRQAADRDGALLSTCGRTNGQVPGHATRCVPAR